MSHSWHKELKEPEWFGKRPFSIKYLLASGFFTPPIWLWRLLWRLFNGEADRSWASTYTLDILSRSAFLLMPHHDANVQGV